MDGRRALVIDDEVHFRYFLRVLLEKAGFAVKMARNGIEALDVLRSWRPDVITLDVMMPEQSGLTFYGAVCRDEDWKRIPVVRLDRRADLRPGTCVRHDRPDAGPASRPRGLP